MTSSIGGVPCASSRDSDEGCGPGAEWVRCRGPRCCDTGNGDARADIDSSSNTSGESGIVAVAGPVGSPSAQGFWGDNFRRGLDCVQPST